MSFATIDTFNAALKALPCPDSAARAAAKARQDSLTKPPGALGRLEEIAEFFAGWQGRARPRLDSGRVVVFAGNHGIAARAVSAFPADVTAQMVDNFTRGGAAINALAACARLDLRVVPLHLDQPTNDFTQAPAMSEAECLEALSVGAQAVTPGLDIFIPGEMGIGNSTAAAAICLRSFGGAATDWVGPGSGLDPAAIRRKAAIVAEACARHAPAPHTPFETLRRLGGREIAAMAGAMLRARQLRIPVVLDGFIATAALAPLAVAAPDITAHCLAGHCSAEPGHRLLLQRLGLSPLLDLGMRLGEGSGAAVAVQIIRSALAAHDQMATFAEAGVSHTE